MPAPDSGNPLLRSRSLSELAGTVRDQFASAWKGGNRPQVEDFLRDVAEPDRTSVLRELLLVEWQYRQLAGEEPTVEEYRPRFPEHEALIREVAATSGTIVRPASELESVEASQGQTPTHDYRRPSTEIPQGGPFPTLPGYEILGVLGRGGMGVVYQARDLKLKRLVAVKMIRAGTHADEGELARFRVEAEAVARLQHPNIVQIYAIGEHEGLPFVVLEFLKGGSLKEHANGTPLPPHEAARIVEILARAMQAAHDLGIIHRDLKPANVLLTADGIPKISDFGLAKKLEDESGQTQTGAVIGTPSYMSPEQAAGRTSELGPLTDIYALGAILYELLTGRPPFKAATPVQTLRQVLDQEPVAPRQLNPAVDRDAETICLKSLSKEQLRRYSSASDLAEDLKSFQNGEPVHARPIGRFERAIRWVRRHPIPTASTIFLLFSLAAFGSYWLTRPAYLNLRVNPSHARVTLDGQLLTLKDGGGIVPTSPGRHVIEATADAHETAKQDLVLVRGRENTASTTIDLEVLEGHLQLDSSPRGATVEVLLPQGPVAYRGTTPFHSPPLLSGDYRIMVSLPLYSSQVISARVPTGGRVTMLKRVTLTPAFQGSESLDSFRNRRDRLAKITAKPWMFEGLPFSQALQFISETEGIEIHPDQVALEEEGIPLNAPITLSQDGLSLEMALERLLKPLPAAFIPFWNKDKLRLEITSHGVVENLDRLESVVFPVEEPLKMTGHGVNEIDALIETIYDQVRGPWMGRDGDGGQIQPLRGEPVIRVTQHWKTLVAVDDFLRDLRSAEISRRLSTVRDVLDRPSTSSPLQIDARRRELEDLTSRVRSFDQTKSNPTELKILRQQTLDYLRLHSGTAEAWKAASLPAALAWPLDDLKAKAISPSSLASIRRDSLGRIPLGLVAVIGDPRLKHWGPIRGIAISRDGKLLASVGAGQTVCVWNALTGELQQLISIPFEVYSSETMAFNPAGDTIAFGGWHAGRGNVVICDVLTGQVLGELVGNQAVVRSLAWSPNGRELASGTGAVLSADRSQNGNVPILIWDVSTRKISRQLTGHNNSINSLAVSDDGNWLVSAGADRVVTVWELATGQAMRSWTHPIPKEIAEVEDSIRFGTGLSAAIAPDAMSVVTWGNMSEPLKLWDRASGSELKSSGSLRVNSLGTQVAFLFGTPTLAITSPMSDRIELWDLSMGTLKGIAAAGGRTITTIRACPTRAQLAVGLTDGGLEIWNISELLDGLAQSEERPRLVQARGIHDIVGHLGMVDAVSLSDNGRLLATLGRDHRACIWDIDGHLQRISEIPLLHKGSLTFCPGKGTQILVPGHQLPRWWDATTGDIRPFSGALNSSGDDETARGAANQGIVQIVICSPDGQWAAAAMSGPTVQIWNLAREELVQTLRLTQRASALVFSPDGVILVTGEAMNGIVSLWEVESGQRLRRIEIPQTSEEKKLDPRFGGNEIGFSGGFPIGSTKLDRTITGIVFSANGRRLESACINGMVGSFDLNQEDNMQAPQRGQATAVASSLNDELSAIGSSNGTVQLVKKIKDQSGSILDRMTWYLATAPQGSPVGHVVFTPDGRHMLTANANGTISVIRLVDNWKEMELLNVVPLPNDSVEAPILSSRPPLWQDEFTHPGAFPVGIFQNVCERGYREGRYFIKHTGRARTHWTNGWSGADFACEVLGRTNGGAADLWGVGFHGDTETVKDQGFEVLLSGDGRWRVRPESGKLPAIPSSELARHPALKSAKEFNTLLVTVHGREVEVFANGVALCKPFRLDHNFAPVRLDLILDSQQQAEVEFERFSVWRLTEESDAPGDIVVADFEGEDYGTWIAEGEAFGSAPARGTLPDQGVVYGYRGRGLVNSFRDGDKTTGKLTSPPFKIERKYLNMLIGGGGFPRQTCVNLLVDGKVIHTANGPNTTSFGKEALDWTTWNVSEFMGRKAVIQIIDQHTGGWGHISVDHIVQSDTQRTKPP